MQGANAAFTLALSIGGGLCLWSGLGALMEKSGITGLLSGLLAPFLRLLFPSSGEDSVLAGALSANICANFLGLGNAATPMGIQATKRMNKNGTASHELCRLIVLNTASIQLIPANVAAIRTSLGCACFAGICAMIKKRKPDILSSNDILEYLYRKAGNGKFFPG